MCGQQFVASAQLPASSGSHVAPCNCNSGAVVRRCSGAGQQRPTNNHLQAAKLHNHPKRNQRPQGVEIVLHCKKKSSTILLAENDVTNLTYVFFQAIFIYI